ncbi:MAG: hypothetical protein R3B09_18800 [Nannocystaceae bacterium]
MPRPVSAIARRPLLAGIVWAALPLLGCTGRTSTDPTTAADGPRSAQGPVTPPVEATPSPAPAPAAEVEPAVAAAPAAPVAAPITRPDPLAPLSDDQRARFLAGEADALAPTPIHYVKSNEVRHDVFFPYVEGLGGAYVGVGSDQNYTILANARAELVFLLDIDQRVVDLHRIYGVLIAASPTPEALHARWSAEGEAESLTLLDAAFADLPAAEQKRLRLAYRGSRETVHLHLRLVIKRQREGAPTGWLSSPAMYDHVRALWLAGRVRTMGGDLTGTRTLQTIGKVAADFGAPVRVVYFSNAEEYFKYTPAFIANVLALQGDERSVLLRTIYSKDWEHADQLWAYQVQPLADFQARLGERKNRSRNPMLKYAEQDGSLQRVTAVKGLSLLGVAAATAEGG